MLEETLRAFEEEAETYPRRIRQLLAVRCYLRRIIAECGARWMQAAHGVTHFAELVDEIERWRAGSAQPVFYVTFNYDTMLEDVLGPWHDSGFDEMTSYMRPQFSLFKLHGSVDWGRQVPFLCTSPTIPRGSGHSCSSALAITRCLAT